MALIGRCAAARGPPGWVANPTTRRRTSTLPPDHAPSNIQKWRVLTAHTRHFWLFDVGQLPRAGGWRPAGKRPAGKRPAGKRRAGDPLATTRAESRWSTVTVSISGRSATTPAESRLTLRSAAAPVGEWPDA